MATVLLTPFRENSTPREANQALKLALKTMAKSRHCAVLWFAEIMDRKMYRQLGYSSIYPYAEAELGFSSTRTGDFRRLVLKLAELPKLKKELEKGKIGYTKGLEVAKVANAANEKQWLEEARNSNRGDLAKKVGLAKKRAANEMNNPEQRRLLAAPQTTVPVAAVKHHLALEMTTEQLARFEALWEKLHKLGGVPAGSGKVELVLQGLAKLVETAGKTATTPPVQIVVQQCPDCAQATITTGRGEVALAPAEIARLECDARIAEPGQPNRATIPPAVKRKVLSRDRQRCQGKGCPNTHFLEVHHIVPRNSGGSNKPANLVTLCGACHQLLHERQGRGLAAGILPAGG